MNDPRNLAARLEARAAAGGWAGDVAFLAGERCFTHADVHDGGARMASLLAATGVRRGNAVLVALPDGPELVWAFLGAVRLGAVAVLVNPRVTAADHRFAAADVAARAVVCSGELASRFDDGPVVLAEGLEDVLAEYEPARVADVGPGDAAYAQYTSGTTGTPKAALHGHDHPLAYFEAFARGAIAIRRDDVLLSVSKLYFAYGLGNSLLFPLLAGCRAVLHAGHPRPEDVAALTARHRVTVLFGVPTFYAHLVAYAADAGSRRCGAGPFSSLRAAVSAGEALAPALAERVRAVLGCPVLDGIGSTEVGQTFASNTVERWRDGTVGRALPPYRVRVRDAEGREVPPGETGNLWVAGPSLLLGYLGHADVSVPVRDGWLLTGDRAELDADGYLRLRGRSDDLEKVGGISVSPLEIESVLARHPAVVEVAVAGVVGDDGASRLKAFVVPGPGVTASGASADALAADLVALARAELAPFKVPRSVVVVDALPRTATGKLRRFVLRAGAWPPERCDQPAASAPNRSR